MILSFVQVDLSVGEYPSRTQTLSVHSAAFSGEKQFGMRTKPCLRKWAFCSSVSAWVGLGVPFCSVVVILVSFVRILAEDEVEVQEYKSVAIGLSVSKAAIPLNSQLAVSP